MSGLLTSAMPQPSPKHEQIFHENWLEFQSDDSMCLVKLLPHVGAREQLVTPHIGLELFFWCLYRQVAKF